MKLPHGLFEVPHLNSRTRLCISAAGILLVGLLILLPIPGRSIWAMLLFMILPTLLWTGALAGSELPITVRGMNALGLTYVANCLVVLILHYLPGPMPRSLVVGAMAFLNIALVVALKDKALWDSPRLNWSWGLTIILLLGLVFRATNILYSEIEGDEALILRQSAEAIGGRDDVLFWHKKGPVELLVPITAWLANGTMNEGVARLPFMILSLGAVAATYELSRTWSGKRAALLAAGLVAVNGYFVAYGRIAQYQSALLFALPLAFLCIERDGPWWALVSGLFLEPVMNFQPSE